MTGKTVYYASVGPALTLYDVDVDNAALTRRTTVTLPANIQYAWPHPSRRFSLCGVEQRRPGHRRRQAFCQRAYRSIRRPARCGSHGDPAALPSRPIHTTRRCQRRVFAASPTTIRATSPFIASAPTARSARRDRAAEQARTPASTRIRSASRPATAPSMLVTRGNNAGDGKPEDPGAIKTLPLRQRRADQSRLDRARQRARLRAAPSRFSSDKALGVRLGRAAEQALRL